MITRCLLFVIVLLPHTVMGARINDAEAVMIGGIKQWIKFQGDDDKAPVLLFLHGGPGNSVMGYADRFTRELQKHFVVVHWDQRESGNTAKLNTSKDPLTVSLYIRDAIEVIQFVSGKFSQEQIYLVGHSWGGYLGLRVVTERPDLIKGYFAISPMINQLVSERLSLNIMQSKAIAENNKEAIDELSRVEVPFKSGQELFYHRKWLSKLMGSATPDRTKVDYWSETWLTLFNEGSLTNFNEFAPNLNCPVYFLIGSNDYQTHFSLVESYYKQVVCREKKLYWFAESAHNPHLTETEKFQKIIIDITNRN